MKIRLFYFLALLLTISCQKDIVQEITLSESAKGTSSAHSVVVSGKKNGGNVTCEEAAASAGVSGYAYSTGRQNFPFSSNAFGDNVVVEVVGNTISWTINPPAGFCVAVVAVIVKGGPAANIYYYYGQSSAVGLTAPVNASGNPAGISNVTICYNLVPCSSCNWTEETAYGGGIEGPGPAWWYAIDASQSGTYPIYAGQQVVSGASISYDAITDVITIDLGQSMRLQSGSQTVKAEGYNTLPTSRPPSGQFQLYKGTDLTIQGNGSAFYVVHMDVEVCN